MTTSIPESAHSGRNWDHRYCWLRDAFFVVRAQQQHLRSGHHGGLPALVEQRGGRRRRRPHPAAVWHWAGERPARAFCAPAGGLPGWACAWANQAAEHFQHDVYGNIALARPRPSTTTACLHRAGLAELRGTGGRQRRVYGQPDAGMWSCARAPGVHPVGP